MRTRNAPRILDVLKSSGPVSAAFVARRVGLSEVGARQHLNRLQERGLVGYVDLVGSVGRPKRAWSLSATAEGAYPDRHADLALDMLRATREAFGNFGIEGMISAREGAMLVRYRAAMAGADTLRARLQCLAELRTAEGYVAELREGQDGSYLLIESHCPIRAAASQCQALCRSELELFRKVLGERVAIERTEHALAGQRRCTYRIAPAVPSPASGRG